MKILHVIQTIDTNKGGGVTARNLKIIEYLERLNTDNYILTLNNNKNLPKQKYKSKTKIFTMAYFNERFPIPIKNIFLIGSKIRNVDIVHLTSFWTILNAYSYIFCKVFKKKYIICPAGSLFIVGRSKLLKYIYNFTIGNNIVKDAAAIIAITDKEVEQFLSINIPENKIFKIPNGVELNNIEKIKFIKEKEAYFKKYKPYILYVGRLNFIKGPDILIKSFNIIADQIPRYNLVIAGNDDGMGKELKIISRKSKFSNRIHFIGFVKGIEKEFLYKNADLLVIPSRSEAMSLVVLEAALHGLESIFTDQCGLDELSKENLGTSVPVNIKLLSEAINLFLKSKNKQKMNLKLKNYVAINFNWEKISKKYLEVLKNSLR